jgi:hypothetical protein
VTDGFTFTPKEGVLRIFSPLKILGTKGQHATSRPPKPLSCDIDEELFHLDLWMDFTVAI